MCPRDSIFLEPAHAYASYKLLWWEQLGGAWREASAAFTWPVLGGAEARWAVRAGIDELQQIGLEAFTKKHDPYWNIPLNENLPQPVINLPIPAAAPNEAPRLRTGELLDFQTTAAPPSKGRLFTEQPVVRKARKGRRP